MNIKFSEERVGYFEAYRLERVAGNLLVWVFKTGWAELNRVWPDRTQGPGRNRVQPGSGLFTA
jgi:hypothetical protein